MGMHFENTHFKMTQPKNIDGKKKVRIFKHIKINKKNIITCRK